MRFLKYFSFFPMVLLYSCVPQNNTHNLNQIKNKCIGYNFNLSKIDFFTTIADSTPLNCTFDEYENVLSKVDNIEFSAVKDEEYPSITNAEIDSYSLVIRYEKKDQTKEIFIVFTKKSIELDVFSYEDDVFYYADIDEKYYQATKDYYLTIFH